eukprot:scpid49770/ scgid23067/ 
MLPFVASELHAVVTSLAGRFLKETVVRSLSTPAKLISADFADSSNHVDGTKISLGFAADKRMTELKRAKKVSERDLLAIRVDTKLFLLHIIQKVLEKSPLRYQLVRTLQWLAPAMICGDDTASACARLNIALKLLVDAHVVAVNRCDDVLRQYKDFCRSAAMDDSLVSFTPGDDLLDTCLFNALADKPQYSDLWPVVRKLLLLSHRQASVERGFSINKEVTVENQAEHSLTAPRLTSDHLNSVGGVRKGVLSK